MPAFIAVVAMVTVTSYQPENPAGGPHAHAAGCQPPSGSSSTVSNRTVAATPLDGIVCAVTACRILATGRFSRPANGSRSHVFRSAWEGLRPAGKKHAPAQKHMGKSFR